MPNPSPRSDAIRRLVAWGGHAPGLWLLYREPIPRPLRRPNLYAAVGTIAAIGIAVAGAPAGQRLIAGLATWAVGHVAWGTYLAWHLPPRAE